jgi:hypothetical protein
VFVTQRGSAWIHFTPAGGRIANITIQFTNLLKGLGLHRNGIGFYTLRHVFRTVADAARDPVAIDIIMGHSDPSMGSHYRERVDDSRLKAVTDYVQRWLFVEPSLKSSSPVVDGETESRPRQDSDSTAANNRSWSLPPLG